MAAFLTHLVAERRVAAAAPALSAVLFLWREALERPLGRMVGLVRPQRRVPLRWC